MTNQNSHSNGSSAKHRMFSLIWPGALAVQAIYCAARLKLADYLSAGVDGIECLSTASNTHPVALRRLMRALCSLGIVTEREPDRFALTELGQTLRSEDPSGVHPWAVMFSAPFVWRPWGRLLETIQTGETAFRADFRTHIRRDDGPLPGRCRDLQQCHERGDDERGLDDRARVRFLAM